MTDVIDTFKDAIDSGLAKSKREELGLSQVELAQRLGVSSSAINRWESGKRVPKEEIARGYLEALGIAAQDDGDEGECPEGQHRMPDGSCMDDEEMSENASARHGIKGVASVEGVWTGDGRKFAEFTWPDPAGIDIPFQWQKESSHGGDSDVTVQIGRLTSLAKDGNQIVYEGFIDLGNPDGAEYVRRRETAGSRGGVSIVGDNPEQAEMEVVFDGDEPVGVLFHSTRIRALTAVDVPAIAEAYVELTGAFTASAEAETAGPTGKPVTDKDWDGSASRFDDEQFRMSTAGCDTARGETVKEQCFLPHHEPNGDLSRSGVHNAASRVNQVDASAESIAKAKSHLRSHYTRDLNEEPPDSIAASAAELAYLNGETAVVLRNDGLDDMRTLIAAATTITIDDAPPKAWFEEPQELPTAGAITVTEEGRFYGLLAPKSVAHRSFRDRRVEVPTGNVDYSRWMNRQTLTAEGEVVYTGPITMQCGHASTSPHFRADPNAAMQHYDNSCSVVATARIGENAHGVWIAGALLPDVDRASVARVMACQLSGDWQDHRESPGMREFVAALLVPVPGFPVGDSDPSLRMNEGLLVASASPVNWVAAGALPGDESDSEEEDVTGENENETTEGDEAEQETQTTAGVVDDLPSLEEVEQARQERELRAKKIAEMSAELGLDKEDDNETEGE